MGMSPSVCGNAWTETFVSLPLLVADAARVALLGPPPLELPHAATATAIPAAVAANKNRLTR
jgi:hypothetical protein